MSKNTQIQLPIMDRLRESVRGEVVSPDDLVYDQARHAFFTGFDRRPAAIVRPLDATDVARVVNLARESGTQLAVRSGGHSRTGDSTSEGGIVVDLSAMNAVEIEPDRKTVWAQAGVTAGEFTGITGLQGRATGLGDTATVGLGGISLAGGMGFLVRKHGLTIDDILAAELVTADGALVHVDEREHPDLFWALRGGGGNFGVLTKLRLRLHEIDQVVGGLLVLPATPSVISGLFAAADAASEDLSLIAKIMKSPPLPFIQREHHGKPVVMIRMVYAGDPDDAEGCILPIRKLAAPVADMVRAIRYPEMYAAPEPAGPAFSAGTNLLLDDFPSTAAESILTHLASATAAIAVVEVRVLGGAMARVDESATAFAHRRAKLMVNISAMDHRVDVREQQEAWASALAESLSAQPLTPAYVGFIGSKREDDVRRVYPPAILKRLALVKRRYDPTNLFHMNLNIAPAVE